MTRDEARLLFSDYLEDALEPEDRDALQAFLTAHPDAAAELITLERTLSLLHRLPGREPSLDLWPALLPEVEAFRAERRLGLPERLRLHWAVFAASVSEGIVLWTHTLTHRVHHRLGADLHTEPERRTRR